MLGEAALTPPTPRRYYASYEDAIHAIGKISGGRGVYAGPGISVKLSALHPALRALPARAGDGRAPATAEVAGCCWRSVMTSA